MKNFLNKRFIIIITASVVLLFGIYIVGKMGKIEDKGGAPVDWAQSQDQGNEQDTTSFEELSGFYANDAHGFSFRYPKDFEANEFTTEEGGIVIVVGKKGGEEEFQILASPFDESGPLTQERITQDIPEIVIEQPIQVIIAGETAILFWSNDSVLGKTREVWFTHGMTLYQVSSAATLDATLSRVMATWEF